MWYQKSIAYMKRKAINIYFEKKVNEYKTAKQKIQRQLIMPTY